VPIKDTSTDKVIGVCQAINKEGGIFNADDEGIFSILAQQAGLILRSSIKYNQTITNQTKTKRVISIGVDILRAKTPLELQKYAEKYLQDLINVEKVVVWFNDFEKNTMWRFNTDTYIISTKNSSMQMKGNENDIKRISSE